MFLIPLSAFHRPNTVPKSAASSFIQLFPLHYTNTGPNTGWVLWDKAGPNVETKTQKSGGPILCGFEGKNKVKVEVSFAICSFVEVIPCAVLHWKEKQPLALIRRGLSSDAQVIV